MADTTPTPELFEFELVGGEHDGLRFRHPTVPTGRQVPILAPITVEFYPLLEPDGSPHFCTLEYDLYQPVIIDHGYSMSDEGVYRLVLASSVRCECRSARKA